MEITPSREYLEDLTEQLKRLLNDDAAIVQLDYLAITTIIKAVRMMVDIWRPVPDDRVRGPGDITPTREFLDGVIAKLEDGFGGDKYAELMLNPGESFVVIKAMHNATDIWRPVKEDAQ